MVAEWYCRLNGFLSIPGFIVHLDETHAVDSASGRPRAARTEADLIGVRFPNSQEVIAGRTMQDDPALISPHDRAPQTVPMFVLVEVKAGVCRMNGPWTDRNAKNMQRVIRRLGFAESARHVDEIAESLYAEAAWKGRSAIIQYICIGGRKNPQLAREHRGLVQIDWAEIGAFFHRRFTDFPEKLPSGYVHDQWPAFGREFGSWFVYAGRGAAPENASQAVRRYVESGTLE